MPFIDTLSDSEIDNDVRAMYERQASFWGFVPNYAKVFCYRPAIMDLWAALQAGIKKSMGRRRYEIVTFAAATALRSTLCSLGHGKTLTEFFSMEDVKAIANDAMPTGLSAIEIEIVKFAKLVARDASAVTRKDVERLKELGLTDAEVFDISAAAGARAFWTKLIESLGVAAEPSLLEMDAEFTKAMTVGRPLNFP
jgi:alkylhydroperoxidase family enzyme